MKILRKAFFKLKDNKKLRVLVYIGAAILLINLVINFLRELNHHKHFFIAGNNGTLTFVYHVLSHPVFVFFQHSWIEIVSAILVYFLLEDKFKSIDRIPEQGVRDHSTILKRFESDAKENILILDTSIYTFTKEYEHFSKCLLSALDNGQMNIRILLLHPDTYAAEQRSKDLTFDTRTYLENMKTGLFQLHEFKRNLPADKRNRIQVKLFKNTPMMIFAKWDNTANFGLLHPNNLADKGDTFLVTADTPLIRSFDRYFDELWNAEKGKKIVNLEDYLFVKIRFADGIISDLIWGGDDESREMPKYVTDYYNHQESLPDFEKFHDKNIIVEIIHDNNSSYGYIKMLDDKVNSYKTKYAKSKINKTYGSEREFYTYIFQIEYLYDSQITLIDKNYVKEKLDLKGYAFVSHKQYDIKLNSSLKDILTNFKDVFDNNLVADEYDTKGIAAVKETYRIKRLNPRKRLMAVYDCQIRKGIISVRTTELNQDPYLYPFPYEVNYSGPGSKGESVYQVKKRKYQTLNHLISKSVGTENDKFKIIDHYLQSTIKADMVYLSGINDLCLLSSNYKVYVHLIRTWVSNKDGERASSPTPQSDKSTRCDFQVVHLFRRENIIGGNNNIYHGKNMKDSLMLQTPLDSVFFKNNVKIEGRPYSIGHNAEAIEHDPKGKQTRDGYSANFGFRDVIVIEYFRKSFIRSVKSALHINLK